MTRPGPGGSVRTGGAGRPGRSGSDPGDTSSGSASDPDLAPLPVVVELTEVPALGGLYLRGVGGTARARATRRRAVAATELPDTALVVRGVRPDAVHLTAYQHLLGETASDALPAGFVHVLAFPVATALMVRADFPLPLLGMVHVANRVEQRRAIRLGETVDIRVRAADLRSHRSGVTVDLVAEVSVADEIAWRGTSTYLAKGYHLTPPTPHPSVPAGSAGPVGPRPSGDAPRSDDPDGERGAWVAPEPTGLWRLDAGVGRRYAAVSGDRNPIHTSALAAKAFGFRRAIAHGMYTAARALADVGAARGDSYVWQVEFAKPVLLPSTVTVRIAADDAGPGGFTFAGWDARSGRRHLSGRVEPLA